MTGEIYSLPAPSAFLEIGPVVPDPGSHLLFQEESWEKGPKEKVRCLADPL